MGKGTKAAEIRIGDVTPGTTLELMEQARAAERARIVALLREWAMKSWTPAGVMALQEAARLIEALSPEGA